MKITGKYFSLLVGAGFAALLYDPSPTLAAAIAPDLGTTSTYGIVSSTFTNSNTAPQTLINGDVCFTIPPTTPPLGITGTTTHPCPPQVGLDQDTALATVVGQATASTCTDISAFLPLEAVSIGGNPPGTFPPGCYFSAGAMNLTANRTITLNGAGVYIFRPGGALTTGAGSLVVLEGGACASDVYWAPVGATNIGANTAGPSLITPTFQGNILDPAGINLGHFANLTGRALDHQTTVTTDANTITVPTCVPVPPPGGVTLGIAFVPTTIGLGGVSTKTITLSNNNATASTLTADLIDTLPSGMTTVGSPTTTCGGPPPTATATSVTLPIGATIPGGTPGTCTVTVSVTVSTAGSFSNTLGVGALQISNGVTGTHSNTAVVSATFTVGALSDSQEPGSVLVFPKFIRGTVLVDGVVTPRTEISVGAVCPPNVLPFPPSTPPNASCNVGHTVFLHFHWVCPGSGPEGICRESDFHGQTTINGKLVFNTEGTVAPGNFISPSPPCDRGYLIAWAEDANHNPIKFDGLIGTAVLRESATAVSAYTAIPIQADTALTTGALIADFFTQGLVFDGLPGHYAAVTGRIYGDVTYEKLTSPFRSTFLTLLTLDVKSNRPNTATFVDLNFYNSQEAGLSTSTNFICWEEVSLTQIDPTLAGPFIGSRKGVVISGPAQDGGGVRRTLLGLVDTLEGVVGNERMFIYGLANDSVGVPTCFVPEGVSGTCPYPAP
jgi:Ice-binding-like